MTYRNQFKRAAGLLAALAVIAPGAYAADEAPAAPTAPLLGDVLAASGITLTGYIDAGYGSSSMHGANELVPGGYGGVYQYPFLSDNQSFALNQVAFTIAKQPKEGWGGLVNITAGQAADALNAAEHYTDNYNTYYGCEGYSCYGGYSRNFNVTQAFIQYATGAWTVIAGKFVTLAGAEVIASPSDYTYSRSLLFAYAIPYDHTGVRVTYAASDTVSLIVGANNGWNSETFRDPTLELGATYAPMKSLSFALSAYIGNEPVGYNLTAQRQLLDAVVTWAPVDALTLILNYDYAKQKDGYGPGQDTSWTGLAGYAIYAVNDMWKLTLRAEVFNDKDGFQTYAETCVNTGDGYDCKDGQKWKEATLSLSYSPVKAVEIRMDAREDWSNAYFFGKVNESTNDATGLGLKKSVFTFGIEGIYKF